MLMIRMQRIGRKNDPAFRILVLEKTSSPKAGTYTDLLGTYNPKTKALTVAGDRVKEWMSKGAQLSPSLKNLLIDKKIIEGTKTAVIAKSKLEKNVAKKAEEALAEQAAAAKAKEEEAAVAAKVAAEAAKAAEEAAAAAPAEEAPAPAEEAPVESAPEAAPVEEPAPAEAA